MAGIATRSTVLAAIAAAIAVTVAACEDAPPTVPPCTPVPGSMVNPCEPRVDPILGSGSGITVDLSGTLPSVRDYLDDSLASRVGHLVVRATFLPDTVRCTADGAAFQPPTWFGQRDREHFVNYTAVRCFVDVRANEYILGSGPATLPVQIMHDLYHLDRPNAHGEELRASLQQLMETGESPGWHLDVREGGISGWEAVLFLTPDINLSTETWSIATIWDLWQLDDGTVVVVHPLIRFWRGWPDMDYAGQKDKLEIPLAAFRTDVAAAHAARMVAHGGRIGPATNLPKVLTNADQLPQFYKASGAYTDPDNPPAQPPPVPPS